MGKYLLNNRNYKSVDSIEHYIEYPVYEQINTTGVEELFIGVEEYSFQFLNKLTELEKEFEQIPRSSHLKILNDFKRKAGLSIGEVVNLILEINSIWRDIDRLIATRKIEDIDTELRTYTYSRNRFYHCLRAFIKYCRALEFSQDIKDIEKKQRIQVISKELNIIAENLLNYSEQIYQILILTD